MQLGGGEPVRPSAGGGGLPIAVGLKPGDQVLCRSLGPKAGVVTKRNTRPRQSQGRDGLPRNRTMHAIRAQPSVEGTGAGVSLRVLPSSAQSIPPCFEASACLFRLPVGPGKTKTFGDLIVEFCNPTRICDEFDYSNAVSGSW